MKNESYWIGPHIMSFLPYVDEMVFYDGGSDDGTVEIIKAIQHDVPGGDKVKLFLDKDPVDLQDDYVAMSNSAMWELSTDYAMFAHPDMFLVGGGPDLKSKIGVDPAYITHLESYAGGFHDKLYRYEKGRSKVWKNIYRLRNPNLGAHYWGAYGSAQEDCYFSEITGDAHDSVDIFANQLDRFPYDVGDSGVKVLHFSDVRDYDRRLGRMTSCLENQGLSWQQAKERAPNHPRVSLKSGEGFVFVPAEWPPEFTMFQNMFEDLRK